MRITDEGPMDSTFDTSPEDHTHGALVGFITGRHARAWSERSQAERRDAVLQQLATLFGPQAAVPIEYVDQDWLSEPWSGGCYCAVMPLVYWPSMAQRSARRRGASIGQEPKRRRSGMVRWKAPSSLGSGRRPKFAPASMPETVPNHDQSGKSAPVTLP